MVAPTGTASNLKRPVRLNAVPWETWLFLFGMDELIHASKPGLAEGLCSTWSCGDS